MLIPNASKFYDINQLIGSKKQLLNYGHQADLMDDKIDDLTLINFLSQNNYDFVLESIKKTKGIKQKNKIHILVSGFLF